MTFKVWLVIAALALSGCSSTAGFAQRLGAAYPPSAQYGASEPSSNLANNMLIVDRVGAPPLHYACSSYDSMTTHCQSF